MLRKSPEPSPSLAGLPGCRFGHPGRGAAEIHMDCHACQVPPPSRAAKPCRGLTMPIVLPPPGVLDAALLVSTDMDMACSTLSQRASSPAVQSEVHGAESRAPRAGAGWPRAPRGCRCRPCMAAGHSPPPLNLVPREAVPALPPAIWTPIAPAKPCS